MTVLFTTLAGAIAKGAAAVGGAVSGAAAGGGALSTLGTLASVGSTIVGGLSSIAAGRQQAAAAESQAQAEEMSATQETINGRNDALTALRRLNSDLSSITVAGYASGLDSSGSVQSAKDQAALIGNENMNMSRDNAAYAAAQRRQQAQQFRNEGRAAKTQGIMGAVSGGLNLFARRNARG